MAGECGIILKAVEPIKSFLFDAVKEYVGYIRSCEGNLDALHKSLNEVCIKKSDVEKKVKVGNDNLEGITTVAANWLHDVRILTEDDELKELMYKDIETAKFVVKMMGKKDLKRRISKEHEMQEVVVKVMKKLKEEMEEFEEDEMRKMRNLDYKQVAEVVVEVMKETIDEFKKLMREDKKMAIIAMRTLKARDLDKLTKDDEEMKEIVREAGNASDEEQWPNHVLNHGDEESSMMRPLLVKRPSGASNNNTVKEFAKKLFTPLANLVIPLGKLMDDPDFKNAVPEAEGVKLGLEVIDGLLIKGRGLKTEMDGNTKQQRGCCCCSLSLCSDYHGRYLMSKSAELMAKHIQDEIIGKCPPDPVTLHISSVNLKLIPTQFLKGLDSRTTLLLRILENLNDDHVDAVGLFGMGGTGKTTLAKEVIARVKGAFPTKVMVEVSHAPDFVRIQAAIAESIDLQLHNVDDVAQRAIRLYNRLFEIEKEKKVLIILDNVWHKLNLDEIGIPRTCKLLLTTRDKEVCRLMDVQDGYIFEVGVMRTNEARELFKSQIGNQAELPEYKNVVERLLSKCGGLPLAIVATANSLKDKHLSSWENFADDLEKPISSQISGDYRQAFSILDTSYKSIQGKEKRIFFLLVCLSPVGSSASIETLMRYGMGLNLFDQVNKLSEAMKRAVTWANELTLSSMLLEGDVKGDVKIHDIVRDFAISCAARDEEHKFMVEGIPRWLDDDTLINYTAMSLTSKNDYSRLSGVEVCKLQILILKGDLSPDFDDDFFSGMVNLKVLAVSNMDFYPSLPESMRKLKKLRTLCIEGCKLGNFELVGELVNLLVLSLRGSSMVNIPKEVGNLRKLQLLDLGGCTLSKLPLIPTNVLNKLSRLEGLYMYNKRQMVFGKKSEYEEANDIENIRLPFLNALELKVRDKEELPFDDHLIKNLDTFRISLGVYSHSDEVFQNFCCALKFDFVTEFLKISCLKVLFKKADYLTMLASGNNENVVPELDQEGFRSLRSLGLDHCENIKYIVDGHVMINTIVFPCLQSLTLENLENLRMICNVNVQPGSFSNLQTIKLSHLDEIQYGLPLIPPNLNSIYVSYCELLEFIFTEDEQVLATKLPFLKTLVLIALPCLLSLVGPKNFSNTSDGPELFFSDKIGLPSLELFKLNECNNVGKLWSKEIHTPEFQNLKDIQIIDCQKLSSVGSPSVFSKLVQLENLSISGCNGMHDVISHDEIEESEIGEHGFVFPQLKTLALEKLNDLESFYGGRCKPDFPKLKTLILRDLSSMKMFAKLDNSSALFNEKIDFPCLEKLKVKILNDEVMRLWEKQSLTTKSNPAPMLRQLELGNSGALLHIPSIVLKNLSSLTLTDLEDGDAVFSSSNSGEKGRSVWIYSELPNLEGLKVEGNKSLKELFEKEDCDPVNDALTSFCGQVKALELRQLPELNRIPVHLFKSIVSLTLFELKWKYLISADDLNSLHQLQFLSIDACCNMEALLINVDSQIMLPSLKHFSLSGLSSFIGISSMPKKDATLLLPSLESLEIEECNELEHFWQVSIFAPRLRDVSFDNCLKLQHFLIGNLEDSIELPSLGNVSALSCHELKSISTASLIIPKLREVKLDGCYKMTCFFPGNQEHDGDLQLPSLEVVDIIGCYDLHEFSLRRLVAPKLTQVTHELINFSMLPYDDLNHLLKEIISNSIDEEELDDDDDDGDGDVDGDSINED